MIKQKMYLVQYGQYGNGRIFEARDEGDAVSRLMEDHSFFVSDLNHEILVFELPSEKRFKVDSSFTIKEI